MAINYGKKSKEELLEIIKGFHIDGRTSMYIALNRKLETMSKIISNINISDGKLTEEKKEDMLFIMEFMKESRAYSQGLEMLKSGANKDDIEKEYSFESFMEE